jgi:hypothetical protein
MMWKKTYGIWVSNDGESRRWVRVQWASIIKEAKARLKGP